MSVNRLDQTFSQLKRSKRKALIGYLMSGFPGKKNFNRLVRLLEKAGLDILELGVPFSDPIADGPTIQRASQIALKRNGVTLRWVLGTVAQLRREGVRLPIVLMSYCNPILAMGIAPFFRAARQAGVDGLIVPDIITEEGKAFETQARTTGIDLIYLVAPTTPRQRIRCIARTSHGFVYVVSLTGVTGARKTLSKELVPFLRQVRRMTQKPLAVGFGLSTPEHLRRVRPSVDGVIVGSALLNVVEKSQNQHFKQAGQYVARLQKALND